MKIPGVSFFKPKKLIVTHDSGFHADDVFAAATLSLYFEKIDQPFIIRRSREIEDIEKADIVFDVGLEYDPEKGRFDHHQREGAGERENGIPYAAFGLIWKHFGKDLVDGSDMVWQAVDDQLAAPIDGPDNGVKLDEIKFPGVKPFYLGDVLTLLFGKGKDPNKEFAEAVQFAKRILSEFIERMKIGEVMRQDVISIYENTEDKELLIIDKPYTRQLVWLAMLDKPEVLFSVFPSRSGDGWKVLGMKDDIAVFSVRKDLPKEWGGLQDKELQKVTGVEDAVFCHRKLFLAEARSKDGAIALAKLALKN
jgi:uncharacterized UPF0160 family protein